MIKTHDPNLYFNHIQVKKAPYQTNLNIILDE